jgi:hypothetical protein
MRILVFLAVLVLTSCHKPATDRPVGSSYPTCVGTGVPGVLAGHQVSLCLTGDGGVMVTPSDGGVPYFVQVGGDLAPTATPGNFAVQSTTGRAGACDPGSECANKLPMPGETVFGSDSGSPAPAFALGPFASSASPLRVFWRKPAACSSEGVTAEFVARNTCGNGDDAWCTLQSGLSAPCDGGLPVLFPTGPTCQPLYLGDAGAELAGSYAFGLVVDGGSGFLEANFTGVADAGSGCGVGVSVWVQELINTQDAGGSGI